MWFGGNWVAFSSGPIANVASDPSSMRSVNALTWGNPCVSRWIGTPPIGDTSGPDERGEPTDGTTDGDPPAPPLVPATPHAASATIASTTRTPTTGSPAGS